MKLVNLFERAPSKFSYSTMRDLVIDQGQLLICYAMYDEYIFAITDIKAKQISESQFAHLLEISFGTSDLKKDITNAADYQHYSGYWDDTMRVVHTSWKDFVDWVKDDYASFNTNELD